MNDPVAIADAALDGFLVGVLPIEVLIALVLRRWRLVAARGVVADASSNGPAAFQTRPDR